MASETHVALRPHGPSLAGQNTEASGRKVTILPRHSGTRHFLRVLITKHGTEGGWRVSLTVSMHDNSGHEC